MCCFIRFEANSTESFMHLTASLNQTRSVLPQNWKERTHLLGETWRTFAWRFQNSSMIACAGNIWGFPYLSRSTNCMSIGPSDECFPITISSAAHASMVAADMAACGNYYPDVVQTFYEDKRVMLSATSGTATRAVQDQVQLVRFKPVHYLHQSLHIFLCDVCLSYEGGLCPVCGVQ